MWEDFFDFLEALVEHCEAVSEELKTNKITLRAAKRKVSTFVAERYDSFADEYRPFLQAIVVALGPKIGIDIAPLTAGLTTLVAAIAGSKEQLAASKELATVMATHRKQAFDAYVVAGFSPTQAFELVLKQAANSQDTLYQLIARLGQNAAAQNS